MNLGLPEIILIVVVALLFFGPSRLPGLGKSVGEAIRGFKKGISGSDENESENKAEKLERSNSKVTMEDLDAEAKREKNEEKRS